MDRGVHLDRTRLWALEAGFGEQEAETIAQADWAVDANYSVRRWRYKGYHFAWLGARRRARRLHCQAVRDGDLVALGEALHCMQDAIGHGHLGHLHHWPGIDRWDQRSEKVRTRIESASRGLLADYLKARGRGPSV